MSREAYLFVDEHRDGADSLVTENAIDVRQSLINYPECFTSVVQAYRGIFLSISEVIMKCDEI